jgi:RHS repeat-associated protein
MTDMPHLPTMEWDYAGRLVHVTRTVGAATDHTYFTYDAAGQRVRKVTVRSGDIVKERLYLGSTYEVYREDVDGSDDAELERESLHVMDDRKRIALVDTKTRADGDAVADPSPIVRYQIDNHLGSATLELSDDADIISYEEYHPYGTSSYRSDEGDAEVSARRYRYTGKERDEETGLYYHGARYYAAWLGRWTAPDPRLTPGVSAYEYVRNHPSTAFDPDGREERTSIWQRVTDRLDASNRFVANQAERAGAAATDVVSRAGYALHLDPTTTSYVAATAGALAETTVHLAGGSALSVANTARAAIEAPGKAAEGVREIQASRGNWETILEGTGKVLEAAGDVAQAGLLVYGTVKAHGTPSGSGAPPGSKVPPSTGGAGRPVHSRYADKTVVYEGQQPRRISGPDPAAEGAHTVLRIDTVNKRVYQGREFDPTGHPVRDIDFTNPTTPSGSFRPGHPGPPHQHRFEVNDPKIGPKSGYRRGPPEPIR